MKRQADDALSCIRIKGTDKSPLENESRTIWKGPQDEDKDTDVVELVETVAIGQGEDTEPEGMMFPIDWWAPVMKFYLAETGAKDLTPINLDELL